uniref:Odorant-binding protein 13 n=1 Tax=Adelphocoris suturalis TaxID=323751 RepID=A0A166IGQ1_9HEMI|nr:odorant-binding protein 13 [Adelphocoris suturalis]
MGDVSNTYGSYDSYGASYGGYIRGSTPSGSGRGYKQSYEGDIGSGTSYARGAGYGGAASYGTGYYNGNYGPDRTIYNPDSRTRGSYGGFMRGGGSSSNDGIFGATDFGSYAKQIDTTSYDSSESYDRVESYGGIPSGTPRGIPYNGYHNNANIRWPDSNSQGNARKNGSSLEDVEPCTILCIFRQMKMTNGDSYLEQQSVAAVLMRRARDPQLKDFIGRTVQMCFERFGLANKGRCESAKLFALCMEEAGKMNCEDWDVNKRFALKNPKPGPVLTMPQPLPPPPPRG